MKILTTPLYSIWFQRKKGLFFLDLISYQKFESALPFSIIKLKGVIGWDDKVEMSFMGIFTEFLDISKSLYIFTNYNISTLLYITHSTGGVEKIFCLLKP